MTRFKLTLLSVLCTIGVLICIALVIYGAGYIIDNMHKWSDAIGKILFVGAAIGCIVVIYNVVQACIVYYYKRKS